MEREVGAYFFGLSLWQLQRFFSGIPPPLGTDFQLLFCYIYHVYNTTTNSNSFVPSFFLFCSSFIIHLRTSSHISPSWRASPDRGSARQVRRAPARSRGQAVVAREDKSCRPFTARPTRRQMPPDTVCEHRGGASGKSTPSAREEAAHPRAESEGAGPHARDDFLQEVLPRRVPSCPLLTDLSVSG